MAADTQRMQSLIPSYRRNGKLFSCEPCRRGKLRCDHSAPTCGRCTRRNKPDQCFYHPAPLTKARAAAGGVGPQRTSAPPTAKPSLTAPYPTNPSRASEERRPPKYGSPPSYSLATRGASLSAPSGHNNPSHLQPTTAPTPASGGQRATASSSPSRTSLDSSMSFKDSKHGYLGATSYSAVLSEYDASLNASTANDAGFEVEDSSTLSPLAPERIQQGAEVLALLRDMPIYERFTNRWAVYDGLVTLQPIIRIWIDDLWSEYGRLVQESNPAQLRSLSEHIFRNTRQPMQVHGRMTATEWAKAASGRNLRWEVIGAILSMTGLVAASINNWDSIFDTIRDSYIDRASFTERMKRASDFCLLACYECEVLNDIYVSYLFGDLVLVQAIKGDAHYMVWQRNGEVCDAIVALGYHQGNSDADTPFFLQQMRKRMFITAYAHDKLLATFLGRPPRLSYRYCKMDMPADMSDMELMAEGAELQHALSKLDANGTNRSGELNRVVWMRVLFQHCPVREDILELALGPDTEPAQLVQRADKIRVQIKKLHDTVPANVKTPPEHVINAQDLNRLQVDGPQGPINAIFAIYLHSGMLHTEFLLERALINRLKLDTKPIIPLARRMLSLVLLGHDKREMFRDFQGDIIYILAVHGLPSAGVLAIELLKQEQSRHYTPDILPRSEVIQDLSVFISALGTVRPGEGNYTICAQGRRALKRVMDQILSPHHPVPAQGPSGGGGAGGSMDQTLLDEAFFAAGNDADFLQWLDNVEWDKALDPTIGAGSIPSATIA